MSDQDKIDLLIDDYLKNRLKGKDLTDFENKLKSDEYLEKQVQFHEIANKLIINNKLKEISTLARGIEREITLKEKVVKYGILTAIIMSIATLGYLYFNGNDEVTSKSNREAGAINSDSTLLREVESIHSTPKIYSSKEHTLCSPSSNSYNIDSKERLDEVNVNADSSHYAKANIESSDSKVLQPLPTSAPSKHDIQLLKSDPCNGIEIEAQITTKGTCSKQENGVVFVQHISGGLPPYMSYVIDSEGNKYNILNGLGVGEYTVIISDASNCSQRFPNISVSSVPCNEDFSFNPYIGEHWELPIFTQQAELKIFDRTSGLYFERAFHPGDQLQWDGHSNKGELKSGYFIFEIVFADGTRKRGSVTIIR